MALNKIKINDTTTVNTGVVYDITKATGQSYDSLSAALGTNGNNVPLEIREGGMSIRFVLTSDNKYVQFRCIANEFTTDITKWQNTDTKLLTDLEILSSPIVNYRDDLVAFTDANPSVGKLIMADGTIGTYTGFSVSSFIAVDNTKQYYYKGYQLSANFLSIAFYDANQHLLYGISGDIPVNNRYYSLRFPSNVKYFRVSYLTGDSLVFFGTVEDGLEKNKKIANVNSINKFDYTKANVGYITSVGSINGNSSFFYSDYIPVKYGDVLKVNNAVGGGIRCEQYDYNFNFIQGTNEPLSQGTFTIVQNARFFRFSGYQDKIKETMCVIGELPSVYVPFNASGANTLYPIDNEMFFVPCGDVLLENLVQVSSTFEDGIFGSYTGGAWETSDYIDISVNQTPFYLYLKSMYRADLKQVEFYDKDKNILKTILGRSWEFDYNEKIIKINSINGCQYIRFSRLVGENGYGLFKFNGTNLQEQIRSVVNQAYTNNKNLIWIGTSIPAGATYPQAASSSCGYNCLNKAVGSSHLCFRNVHPSPVQSYSGYELTATVAELEAMYRQDVTDGVITEEQLNLWKAYSYENSLIPYINGTNDYQISLLVLDHGINDHAAIHAQIQDIDNIDWESRDRTTFVGAFNYLMDKLFEVKHTLKIVIAGHYENKWERFYAPDVCRMQELLAERYNIQIMKTWEYTQINPLFMKGTANYLSEYNQTYGSSWTPEVVDAQGNIMTLQVYMPDILHPHSDLTGNCNKRLNAVFSKLLKNSI